MHPLTYTPAMTQNDMHLALAKSEAEDIMNSTCLDLHKDITPLMMITMGIKHESSQYVQISLCFLHKGAEYLLLFREHLRQDQSLISPESATTLQLTKIQEHDNSL